jgi:hypothetical protein
MTLSLSASYTVCLSFGSFDPRSHCCDAIIQYINPFSKRPTTQFSLALMAATFLYRDPRILILGIVHLLP